MRHRLIDQDDYIRDPKKSGYRGIHLIYEYASDAKTTYNGQKIEIQIRSQQQHAWATAVETVGAFTDQALKSSAGEKRWLRFFVLMSAFQARMEGTAAVPGAPDDPVKLSQELRSLASTLRVTERLEHYQSVLPTRRSTCQRFGVDSFFWNSTRQGILSVTSHSNAAVAAVAYGALEAAARETESGRDVVLVRVESIDGLRRAYPNYFADTTLFMTTVQQAIAP